jgi:surfactin synthase thioesterase subunit
MSDFIADLVYYSWLNKPLLYKQESFEWLVPLVNNGCTQAQAYLAANIVFCGLPIETIEKSKDAILKILENTDYIETLRYAFERSVIP